MVISGGLRSFDIPIIPPNVQYNLWGMNILFWRQWTWLTWRHPAFASLCVLVVYPFSIVSGKAMQKTFLLCRSRGISCIFKRLSMSLSSFNCCGIQLLAFWTIPVMCRSVSFNSSRFRLVSSFNNSYSWASSDLSSTSLRIIYHSFQTFGYVENILYKLY